MQHYLHISGFIKFELNFIIHSLKILRIKLYYVTVLRSNFEMQKTFSKFDELFRRQTNQGEIAFEYYIAKFRFENVYNFLIT